MGTQDLNRLKALLAVLPVFRADAAKTFADTPPDLLKAGVPTTIYKTRELEWLRSKFPDLKADAFKNDDALIKYLLNSSYRNIALSDGLTASQKIELEEALKNQAVATAAAGIQPTAREAGAEQAETMQGPGEAPSGPSSGLPTGRLPSAPAFASPAGRVAGKPPAPEVAKPETAITKEQPLRFRSGWRSSFKTGLSNAGIFAKKNGGRILNGLRGMAGDIAGGAVRGGGNLLVGGLNGDFPGKRTLTSRIGGARRFAARGQGQLAKIGKSRGPLIYAGSIIGLIVITGGLAAFGNPGSEQSIAIAAPVSRSVDYTLPLRDPITPLDIRDQIKTSFPNAKLDNWGIIIQKSLDAKWNPSLVLALWIEKSGAQGAAAYSDAIGCAPTQPTTDINISLSCLFNNFSNFTNDQFPQFMAKYAGGPMVNPFAGNENFPKNVRDWYSKLVPEGTGAIKSLAATVIASCPVPSGKITCGSSAGVPGKVISCHCTDSYTPKCPPLSRRGKAIDIASPQGSKDGDPVYMPLIQGKKLKWYFKGNFDDGYGGILRVFQSEAAADGVWTIHFVHSKATPAFTPDPNNEREVDTAKPVAFMDKTSSNADGTGVHTHVSVGLNIGPWDQNNLQYESPDWKYADRDLGMCIQ